MKTRIDSLSVAALLIALATGSFAMTLVTGNLAMALATGDIGATRRNACNLRLDVEFSPDLPNSHGGGVLGPLLKNPLFPFTWVCPTDLGILIEVTGPGPVVRAGTH